MSYTIYHSTHVFYGNSIKYLIMTLSDISSTKIWQLYTLIIIAIKADNYIHSLIVIAIIPLYITSYSYYVTSITKIFMTLFPTNISYYPIHSLLHYLICHALKTDNYIHSLMMETHFSYTKYLTKCDNIILFHTLVSSYNYYNQYHMDSKVLLSE